MDNTVMKTKTSYSQLPPAYVDDIREAVRVLRQGGIILYPTDTIWGIGCDATDEKAVQRIYALKQREDSKAMICLVDNDMRLQRYVRDVPDVAWQLLDVATRPTTVILDGAMGLASNLIGSDGSVALRITQEPFSHELCYRLERPLVSTSANISGQQAPHTFDEIDPLLLQSVDYVCRSRRDECRPQQPSSIIKLTHDGVVSIIRP